MATRTYHERTVEGRFDPMELAATIAASGVFDEHVVYERAGSWHVGGDPVARAVVDDTTVRAGGLAGDAVRAWQGTPWPAVEQVLADLPIAGWHAFGWADFETAGRADGGSCAAQMMVPRVELELTEHRVLVRVLDSPDGEPPALADLIAASPVVEPRTAPGGIEVPVQDDTFRERVAAAIARIGRGELQKVILSRVVEVPFPIDLCATYLLGRRHNTPARSFLLDLGGWEVAGFSPETVVEVDPSGLVSTQPLAGTRRRTGDPHRDGALRAELCSDPKEVFEHALSVRLAVDELETVGAAGDTRISEFLTVSQRGSVQHLASRVATRLAPSRSAWDAFGAVFPSITASGIPKAAAYALIAELEGERRGLYSGAVLMAGADGMLDAALVLRSVFRREGRSWLRAGAGIVGSSVPERELEETCEKLASVAPYVVPASPQPGGPGPLATLRAAVAGLLGVPAAQLPDDADLMVLGIDSMSLMRLAITLRRGGVDVSYPDLATDPTLRAWSELVAGRHPDGLEVR